MIPPPPPSSWPSSSSSFSLLPVDTVGIRFVPTDQQMIGFLRGAMGMDDGLLLPPGLLCDQSLYGSEPWNLPPQCFMYGRDDREAYFLTCRNPYSSSGDIPKPKSHAKRKAGSGHWHSQGPDPIHDHSPPSNSVIGVRSNLSYVPAQRGPAHQDNWVMHEYLLHPSLDGYFQYQTLCRVYKNDPKSGGRRGRHATATATLEEEMPQRKKSKKTNDPMQRLPAAAAATDGEADDARCFSSHDHNSVPEQQQDPPVDTNSMLEHIHYPTGELELMQPYVPMDEASCARCFSTDNEKSVLEQLQHDLLDDTDDENYMPNQLKHPQTVDDTSKEFYAEKDWLSSWMDEVTVLEQQLMLDHAGMFDNLEALSEYLEV